MKVFVRGSMITISSRIEDLKHRELQLHPRTRLPHVREGSTCQPNARGNFSQRSTSGGNPVGILVVAVHNRPGGSFLSCSGGSKSGNPC